MNSGGHGYVTGKDIAMVAAVLLSVLAATGGVLYGLYKIIVMVVTK